MSATAAIATPYRADLPHSQPGALRSWTHWLALAFVALTFALSFLVFSEPAPVDALTIGLIVLLPTVGLVAFNRTLLGFGALWLVAGAMAIVADTLAHELRDSLTHTGVSLYLYLATIVIAAFVAKNPEGHTELIFKAWTFAALAAAMAALIGYFDLVPRTFDLFTKYGRASGTFKDPNVLGPFIVGPFLYMVHLNLYRSRFRALLPLAVAGVLMFAVLLTFSRGAWFNLALSLMIYGYLTMLTARRNATRLKVIALITAGVAFTAGMVALALASHQISDLLLERASLTQSYDTGPEGRFGGQEKAVGIITENPLGIGALQFARHYHDEDVHNVYLSMMLNAGWLGGGIYWIMVALTVVLGLRHCLKDTETRPLFLIAYAAFIGTAAEGFIVDTDHWRHFYLLMAIIWGLISASRATAPVPGPAELQPRRPAITRRAPRLASGYESEMIVKRPAREVRRGQVRMVGLLGTQHSHT